MNKKLFIMIVPDKGCNTFYGKTSNTLSLYIDWF